MKKLILVALILSLITGVAGFKYLTGLEKSFEVQTKPVVVAKVQIPIHTKVSADMVEIKNFPVVAVNPNSTEKINEIAGLVTKVQIEPFEQVLPAKLSKPDDKNKGLSYSLQEGWRAITVKTDEMTGVGGRVTAGDRIDVVATMQYKVGEEIELASLLVAENLEVLEVGMKTSAEKAEGAYTSLTLAVPADEVLKLNYALTEGKYRLVLRSVVDKNIENVPPYTIK